LKPIPWLDNFLYRSRKNSLDEEGRPDFESLQPSTLRISTNFYSGFSTAGSGDAHLRFQSRKPQELGKRLRLWVTRFLILEESMDS
jgi:hypothetical protein